MTEILEQDFVQRFSFEELDARGCYAHLEQAVVDIQRTHHYPAPLAKLLNEFALSAVLLRDSVKLDGSLSIQYRSNDAVSMIVADCTDEYGVRAVCEYDANALGGLSEESLNLQTLSKEATLTITISPKNGQRYQGVVAIESDSLAQCLQDYFLRSEQLPSRFIIVADAERAIGMSLHALPEQDSEIVAIMKDDWQRLNMLVDTLTDEEMRDLPVTEVLRRLFHEENCRLHVANPVQFKCDCSRDRSLAALRSLGTAEIKNIMSEQPIVSIDCHFCFQRYEFGHDDLQQLLTELM